MRSHARPSAPEVLRRSHARLGTCQNTKGQFGSSRFPFSFIFIDFQAAKMESLDCWVQVGLHRPFCPKYNRLPPRFHSPLQLDRRGHDCVGATYLGVRIAFLKARAQLLLTKKTIPHSPRRPVARVANSTPPYLHVLKLYLALPPCSDLTILIGAVRQNGNSHRGREFIILSRCNYLLAVGSERFLSPKELISWRERVIKTAPLAVLPERLLGWITIDRLFNLWEFNLISCFTNKMV